MGKFVACVAGIAVAAGLAASIVPAAAQNSPPRKPVHPAPPPVQRSVAGTIIQPTTTIIHGSDGRTTVIVIPQRRSYLDTGTEVSVGDRNFMSYAFPPGGDPGRPNWFAGPDVQGTGRYPLPSAFDGMGINPNTPY